MATGVSNNDVLRMSVIWELDGTDDQVNVFTTFVGSVASADADFYDDIEEYLEDLYVDVIQNSPANLQHVRVDLLNMMTGNPLTPMGALGGLHGTSSAVYLPEGVAAFAWARTLTSRRIGRKFLPVWTEDNISDGVWETTALGRLNDFANKWKVPYTASNGTVLRGVVGSSAASGFSTISAVYVASRPAYQRRRRKGRGS